MMKILHLADVHFDGTFRCRSESLRRELRDAVREAFAAGMDAAVAERVDAVLLAGDLFDRDRLSFKTEKLLVDQFDRLREVGIQVFYACGNHDPALVDSRVSNLSLPDNCTVFRSNEPEKVELRSSDGNVIGVVVGAGHMVAHEERNLAASFPDVSDVVPHVGLLHTMVTSASTAESHDRYAPCCIEDLERPGYDYWALGHIHQRQPVDSAERAWYSGNLQGRNPRETGAKGGLLVRVCKGRIPEVTFLPLAPVEWVKIDLNDLVEAQTVSDLERHVEAKFAQLVLAGSTRTCVVVVNLVGESVLAHLLRSQDSVDELEALLCDQLGVAGVEVRTSGLRDPVNVRAYADEPHVLGEVLRMIARMQEHPESIETIAPAELALPSSAHDRSEYLRELLVGLEEEAARRLLTSS